MLELLDSIHLDLSRVENPGKSNYKIMEFKKKDIDLWKIADEFW